MTSRRLLDSSSNARTVQIKTINMSTQDANLPLDDRSGAIKFSYPFVAFFSTLFVVLRIWNNVKTRKFWYANVSDWLLAFAQVNTPDIHIVGIHF